MKSYCIDASVLFYYMAEENHDLELIRILKEINEGESIGLMSTVNLAEFHRVAMRKYSEEIADTYIMWIRESEITIVPLEEDVALLASIKKQQYAKAGSPFAWGDAFCLATAMEMKCDCLVTTDSEFDKVKEIEIIKV